MTTRNLFMQELEELHQKLADMGLAVERAMDDLMTAIENKDLELADRIIKNDRLVNDMERSIEASCLSLITRQQPVAGDLRMISAILKVVTDIERIGDHTSDISEMLPGLCHLKLMDYSTHISPMLQAAKQMVHESVDAFVSRDKKGAQEVIQADDVVDELFSRTKQDIIKMLKEETCSPDDCMDILMIAKYLERVADHAVNICEWEIFQETGTIQDIRII